MKRSSSTRLSVAICYFILAAFTALSAVAYAQDNDVDAPVIELERVDDGILGDKQVFAATVTDNVGVVSVKLHYRFTDDDAYQSIDMRAIGSTDIYTAAVETRGVQAEVIQYYLQAQDAGRNRAIQGFAFDPIERNLVNPGGVATPVAEAPPEPGVSTGRKIFYGVLGVVVLGALASAADDGGSSDGGSSGPRVPLNITVEDPL